MPELDDQTQIESPTLPTAAATIAADDLAAVRDLIIQANPNVVPELVRGATIAELTASVPDAISAYQRIAQAMTGTPATPAPTADPGTPAPVAPVVPAGSATVAVDIDKLPAHEKIRRGLEQLNRQRA